MALETGLGGHVDIRAIVPMTDGSRYVGALEFASNLDVPLVRASETSGLQWAIGVPKETSAQVQRPDDHKTDAWEKNTVFYRYSDAETGDTMRSIRFDPQATSFTLATAGRRGIFVKTFWVNDFTGRPSVAVAVVHDVTSAFARVLWPAVIKAIALFAVLSLMGTFALVKFGKVRASLMGVAGRQKRELSERVIFYDAAMARLKQVDLVKRGFFTNLVTAINEPLQSAAGQLAAVVAEVDRSPDRPGVSRRLRSALADTSSLSRLVEDYQQVELFRQKLVANDTRLVFLYEVVARAIQEDLRQAVPSTA
jgi:hypothetical protein